MEFNLSPLLTRRQALAGAMALGAATAMPVTGWASGVEPPADLDALVLRALATFETPGAAVALVEGGRTVLARGYGVRRLGASGVVDDATAFPIASLTKAFTTASIALLVEEGRLGWDDKVADRLPGFGLHDAFASQEMTVLDLLVHRSGLGAGEGDLLWFPYTTLTRAEIVARLRYLKPVSGFRYGFAYDNVLYIAAGELLAAVAGKPWESFVQERLLTPLGMGDSAPVSRLLHSADRAIGHGRIDGPVRGLGPMRVLPDTTFPEVTAPAGGIWSSARDMARWLTVQLAQGVLPGGKRLWSEDSAARMWTPLAVAGASPFASDDVTDPHFVLSGPGWLMLDYRGTPVVMHAGSFPGGVSHLVLVPSRNFGFSIMLNSEEETCQEMLANVLLDHYLGLPASDWIAIGKKRDDARTLRRQARAAKLQSGRPQDAKAPSLALAKYAGTYRSEWYGDVVVRTEGAGLAIVFSHTPAFHGQLEIWDGDTFRTRFADRTLEDALVTFVLTPGGSVDEIRMKAASASADFSYDYQDLVLKPVGS